MASSGCGSEDSQKIELHRNKELLHVEPKRAYDAFIINQDGQSQSKPPDICKIGNSSVLSKVKAFLPAMQESNSSLDNFLKTHDKAEVDIENVNDDDNFVEMNIGVFKNNDSSENNHCDVLRSEGVLCSSDSESSSSEDSSNDIDFGFNVGEVTCSNLRTSVPSCRKPPMIKEVTAKDRKELNGKLDPGHGSKTSKSAKSRKGNARVKKRVRKR